MTKREAKIAVLNFIADSPLVFSESLLYYDYSDSEQEKMGEAIDEFCRAARKRAEKLEANTKTTTK